MAHYAILDDNNIVINVIYGKDEDDGDIDWEGHYSEITGMTCKRTSYNTVANQHPTKEPFRKNYASIGFTYDEDRDAFIPPKDYPSWVLNEETCRWEAPIPHPDPTVYYIWDEDTVNWVINQEYYDSLEQNE